MYAPSQFVAVLIFATCASVVFAITQRSTAKTMIRYGIFSWIGFVAVVIAASWLMYAIKR